MKKKVIDMIMLNFLEVGALEFLKWMSQCPSRFQALKLKHRHMLL